MKGKRKLTQRILSLLMVFAMVMGMLLEPVQIYAAQPGSGVEVKAGGNQGDGMNPPAENQEYTVTVDGIKECYPGDTLTFTATVKDQEGVTVENPNITWTYEGDVNIIGPGQLIVDAQYRGENIVVKAIYNDGTQEVEDRLTVLVKPLYEISVSANKQPPYYSKDTVEFTATVINKKDGQSVTPNAGELTWSAGNLGITVDGVLTIPDVTSETNITVTAQYKGYQGNKTIVASPIPTYVVSGKVKVMNGQNSVGVDGATVTLVKSGETENMTTTTDQEGNYSFIVQAGSYSISATKAGFSQESIPAVTVTNGGLNDQNITLTLTEQATITILPDSIIVGQTAAASYECPNLKSDITSAKWSTENAVVGIDENSGIVTGKQEGSATICVDITTKYGVIHAEKVITVTKANTTTEFLSVAPNNGGNNVKELKIKIGVKTEYESVTEGNVTLKIYRKYQNEKEFKLVQTKEIGYDNAQNSYYYTYSHKNRPLRGIYKLEATYKGTKDKYNTSQMVALDLSDGYYEKVDIKIKDKENIPTQEKPEEIVYGTKDYIIAVDKDAFIEKFEEGENITADAVKYYFTADSNYVDFLDDKDNPISRDSEGRVYADKVKLVLNNVSQGISIPIQIVREAVGDYAEVSVNYFVKITPKELTLVTNETTPLTYTKVYDKENIFTTFKENKDSWTGIAEITLDGVEKLDKGKVQVAQISGTLPQIDVVSNEKVTLTFNKVELSGDRSSNYVVNCEDSKNPQTVDAQVTIEKRPIYLQVCDGSREYGHWGDVEYKVEQPVTEYKGGTDIDTEVEGTVGDDTILAYPNPIEKDFDSVTYPSYADYQEGSYQDKLTVDANTGDAGTNYKFVFDDDKIKKGTLTIESENIEAHGYRNYVDYAENQGNAYVSREMQEAGTEFGKTWVSTSNRNFKIYANNLSSEGGKTFYDIVCLEDGTVISNPEQAGIDLKEYEQVEDGTGITKTIYLQDKESGQKSKTFDVTLYLDSTNPVLSKNSIGKNNENTAVDLIELITFGVFHKEKDLTATTEVSDGSGSGIREWSYNIMSGQDDSAFTRDAINAYINPESRTCKWQDIYNKAENADNAKLDRNINLPNKENNYVLLVKIKDNVGHEKVYTSNGFIMDYKAPTAYIDLAKDQFKSTTGIYGEDVKLNIHVEDIKAGLKGPKSGIKKVDVQVKADGKVTQSGTEIDIQEGKLLAIEEGTVKTEWTLAELDKYRSIDKEYVVKTKDKDGKTINNSNNVVVEVIVWDNAGNQNTANFNLKIDTKDPVIKAKYTNKAKAENKIYYNEPMQAEITYTERNFTKDKRYLWFEVQVEGKNIGIYSVDELEKELNINTEWEDLGEKVQQDNVDASQLNDNRQHKLILTFDKDDHYVFTPYIKEMAERSNASEVPVIHGEEQEFVIDKVAPVMEVKYEVVNEGEYFVPQTEAERVYSGKLVRTIVTITEHNFALDGEDIQVDVNVDTTKVGAGEKVPDYTAQQKVNNGDVWKQQNIDVYTSTYTFNSDANYTHSITYTDLAGNTVSCGPGYFTVDKTQPTGTVEIKGFGFWESLLEKITFGLFSPSTVDVVMTGADHTSPVNPVQFARFHDQMTRDDLENYNGWSSASQEKPESAAFSVSPDEQFIVYTKVTDYAGNYQYFSSDGMIVDSTKPAPVVTITNLSQAQNGIFNENVTLQIDVEDPTAGETYSGLEKVWYTVSAAGNVTTSETIELLNNGGNKVQGNKTFSKVITVPADVYNSNDVKVQAFATDFSGNQGDGEITELKIDVTNPTISVSWDLNNPLNGRYYKDTRTATVTVTDRNFDPNNVRFSITNTDGTSANISGWSSSSNIGVSDTATSTCQVSFPADGDYTFTLGCTDLAGNSGEYGQTDEFTIDKTIPVMTVSYDNNNARNGNFFKETRTATVTIREHNFHAADVRAAITASLEGSGVSAPSISGFSGSGDVHTATVNYSTDGDYTFDIDYTDMAGNAAADYTQDSFTVDLTAPELEITDVEDKSANNDAVAPKVEATDVNYDAKGVTMTLTGANNGNVEVGKIVSAIQNGQSMKFNDFARTEEMDDLYKLQAKAVDKAGNETQKEIMFSVNRYGSVFILDNDTKDWLKTGDEGYTYIREEKEVGIREINVDAIESRSITVNRDGDLANLKENADFTVKNSGSDAQWKEAHYVIAKNNFEEEGNYTVILNTQDKAQNSMNNTSVKKANKNLPIEFAVDKTAPTVVVSGVEDDAQYRAAERTMIVDVKDNLALTKVSISIDGEKTVYDGEELLKDNGVIETAVASANRWQSIEITAEDAAGNMPGQSEKALEGEPVVLRVLVTPNIVIQYYMNKPLFYGSIAAIVIMAGLIIFLVAKKKKGKNKNSKSMSSVG